MTSSTDWQCGKSLSECLGHLLKENIATDVTFLLGEEKLPVHAHKVILISRSPVFHAMLDGPMAHKGDIEIPDITKETFSLFLQYMYTDEIELNVNMVISIVAAARKYFVDRLVDKCKSFVEKTINIENVGVLLEEAHSYMEEEVESKCLDFINENAVEFLQSERFTSLSLDCVNVIAKSDELFIIDEQDVYEAAIRWAMAECKRQNIDNTDENRRKCLGSVLYEIRFPLINDSFFGTEICCGEVLSGEEMKTVFRMKHQKATSEMFKCIPRRGCRKPLRFIRFLEHSSIFGLSKDAINFSVSNNGYLTGVCFYNALGNEKLCICIKILDDKNKCLCEMKSVTIQSQYASDKIVDVMLDEKILLKKGELYTVHTTPTNDSPITYYGVNGKSVVEIAATTVQFFDHSESEYTNTTMGQIPGIIFE